MVMAVGLESKRERELHGPQNQDFFVFKSPKDKIKGMKESFAEKAHTRLKSCTHRHAR
jgi:hypothetical protein